MSNENTEQLKSEETLSSTPPEAETVKKTPPKGEVPPMTIEPEDALSDNSSTPPKEYSPSQGESGVSREGFDEPATTEPNKIPLSAGQKEPSSPPLGEMSQSDRGGDERTTAEPNATENPPSASQPPPLQKEEYKVIGIEPNNPIVKPVLGFLDKLKELRVRANQTRAEHKDNNLKNILAYARAHGRITNNKAEKICGVKDDRATEYLNILVKKGQLLRFGKTKNTFYKPTG